MMMAAAVLCALALGAGLWFFRGISPLTVEDMQMDAGGDSVTAYGQLDEDGTLKAFEINLRQGRSNHYLTASGINPARLVTEDYVFNRELNAPEPTPVFWYSVPKKVVYRYCEDEALVLCAKKLAKEGKSETPLKYRYDLRGNLWRRIFVFETLRRHHKKYKTYCQRAR